MSTNTSYARAVRAVRKLKVDRLAHKRERQARRGHRVRSIIHGTAEQPRLSIHISNVNVTAQVIDDNSGKTLTYATTIGKKYDGNLSAKAASVGVEIAKKAKKVGVSKVIFDRGAKKYHGRTKALADAARAEGLEF